MQALWIATGAMTALALAAGLADWRRGRRRDPDRVGWVPWPTVQVLALVSALACASIALHQG